MAVSTACLLGLFVYFLAYARGLSAMRETVVTDDFKREIRREVPCDGYNCRFK